MRILIIGCRGFIGKHLFAYYKKSGEEVFGCTASEASSKNEDELYISKENPDFESVIKTVMPDICINASGAGSVSQSFVEPHKDFCVNVINLFSLLSSIGKVKPDCKVLNISSASVYGNTAVYPTPEIQPANPQSPYAFHKYIGENICANFFKNYRLPACNLRVYSAYGPQLRRQIFWDLFQRAKNDRNLSLWGTGNEMRDFIFIDDLISAIDLIIRKARFQGEIINVGFGKSHSIREASELFCSFINNGISIQFSQNQRNGDPVRMEGDFTQLRQLGFVPAYNLSAGLKLYYEWLKSEE